jgi:glycosyltransferase involved in cell wall biosynthesis
MPTANRPQFVGSAIACFQAQTYEPKELLILDDGDSIKGLIPRDDRIRYFQLEKRLVLGAKQNLGCDLADGEVICHWDDDDWSSPLRMEQQVEALLHSRRSVTGYHSMTFYDEIQRRVWRYQGPLDWVVGSSLCYRKSYWADDPFPSISVGQDTYMVLQARSRHQLLPLPGLELMVARRHSSNTSPFFCWPKYYEETTCEALPRLFLATLEAAEPQTI